MMRACLIKLIIYCRLPSWIGVSKLNVCVCYITIRAKICPAIMHLDRRIMNILLKVTGGNVITFKRRQGKSRDELWNAISPQSFYITFLKEFLLCISGFFQIIKSLVTPSSEVNFIWEVH